ncbi:50S ribosomal protein P1 [Candidatus Woesearchaeota archaeon]|nr:50S ribosomal protein P1 [Candidatus Woesearchaeota archaeon]
MELLYAALLLHKLGKPVNEVSIKKVLESADASVDETKIKALISALADIDIEKVIKEASMPVAAAPQAAAKTEAKEEKKNEKKPEDAAVGLSSLFG